MVYKPTGAEMIRVKKIDSSAIKPTKAHEHDAGFDLYAVEPGVLVEGARAMVDTGYAWAIPPGYVGFVVPRSGYAWRDGISVINSPGSVDCGYRDSVKVLLENRGRDIFRWRAGDRIAQLVVVRIHDCNELEEVTELAASERGESGFGSTNG